MSRDDLYGHYRRYYTPGNATLVIVGDVAAVEACRAAERRFGPIPAGAAPPTVRTTEPEQTGARELEIVRDGTTAYLKVRLPRPGRHRPRTSPPCWCSMRG